VGASLPARVEKPSWAKSRYVPRQLNVLQALLRAHFEGFAAIYESQYARRYGRFRLERITEAVMELVRCGDYRFGVARLKCSNPACGCEMFRPFSCKAFYLCPSCSQKRTLLFAEFLSENLLLRLPHRVLTFTVPKLLRPYFRHNRTLFAELMQLINRMIVDFQSAVVGRPITGGSVLAYQSSGEFPAISSPRPWNRPGRWLRRPGALLPYPLWEPPEHVPGLPSTRNRPVSGA